MGGGKGGGAPKSIPPTPRMRPEVPRNRFSEGDIITNEDGSFTVGGATARTRAQAMRLANALPPQRSSGLLMTRNRREGMRLVGNRDDKAFVPVTRGN